VLGINISGACVLDANRLLYPISAFLSELSLLTGIINKSSDGPRMFAFYRSNL